jgi:hypothetical protein
MLLRPEETGALLCSASYEESGSIEDYQRWDLADAGEAEVSLFWNDNAMWVVFRGTESTNLADWLRNLRAYPVVWPGVAGRWHAGYKVAVQNVGLQLMRLIHKSLENRVLYIAGHSAGGGMAQAFGGWIADVWPMFIPKVAGIYTYGAPRCTTRSGTDRLQAAFGIERLHPYRMVGDRVTRTPPALLGYRHMRTLVTLKAVGSTKLSRLLTRFVPVKLLGTHAIDEYVLALLE